MRFTVVSEGRDSLGLRQLAEDFANGQWVPDHYTPDQAAQYVLDQFKRTVAMELNLLVVSTTEVNA